MTSLQWKVSNLNMSKKDDSMRHNIRGFSLLEMLIVVCIGMILTGISFVSLQPLLKQARADAAYDMTLMTLRNFRSRAITERRRYIITFTAPRTLTIQSWGVGFPIAPAPVLVSTLILPSDVQFMVQAGIPSTPTTVPDGFGNGGTAIDFGQGLGAGSLNYVMFMPNGTSQDKNNPAGESNLSSGVLYMGRPNEVLSMRAITVLGSTGRIRGWRLQKPAGAAVWTQQ
jgi:type II secretory pathway pseudopilin PulG